MNCSENQCCAEDNNARCKNLVTYGGSHCEKHRPTAGIYYLAYKKLSDIADKLDINEPIADVTARINHVMKCYVAFDKTFHARMKHRKYAYVPECHDDGHDYQFVKLKAQLDACETILAQLYMNTPKELEYLKDSDESEDSKQLSIKPIKPIKTIKTQVNKYNSRRRNTETETGDWINKYIEENKVILSRRKTLIGNIVKFVAELFDSHDLDFIFAKCVMIFNLTRRLYVLGYFPKDFQGRPMKEYIPYKCMNCNCGEYEANELELMCGCIYQHNTIAEYFNLSTEDALKQFFGTALFNRKKIAAIVEDIKLLYLVHQDHVMFLKLWLVWDPSLKRLKIVQNFSNTPVKYSKLIATSRLKKKYYYENILNKV
jgi:hypothetical protein